MKPHRPTPPVSIDLVAARLFRLSLGVFFIGGFVASSISLLVPRMRLTLGLDYLMATSVQLASFSSYLLFAVPVAAIVAATGFMRAHAIGLAVMALGCVALAGGIMTQHYGIVLAALLAVSTGATFLQIASNTAVTIVGDPRRAAMRLNLLQGFNSFGTVVGPALGATTIVSARAATDPAGPVLPFAIAALVLALLAAAFFHRRDMLQGLPAGSLRITRSAWVVTLGDRRLLAGAGGIFLYVGAEVTIGTLLTDFLMTRHALAWRADAAAGLVALYWGGAMIGRFAGAAVMRSVSPARVLGGAAVLAALLVGGAVATGGAVAAGALLAVGIVNSIMYPTIYVMALPVRPERTAPGAMVLCIAVIGGAVIPMLTGALADRIGLVHALLLPAACYLPIAAFARRYRTPRAVA
ncbi:MFS transporter [Sphingomonas hankookensis]|uniref:MFS transporter n=1 Tax=Sphingomonas hengshuiensis TaxID=1609977 RepID=A0A2W4Z0L2_9SPHN|nr:MAG: MFS transporter [Sphingomonas hengshuiensis]